MNLVELKESKAKFIHDARSIINLADAEKRQLSNEENEQVDRLFEEGDKLEAVILTEEKKKRLRSR